MEKNKKSVKRFILFFSLKNVSEKLKERFRLRFPIRNIGNIFFNYIPSYLTYPTEKLKHSFTTN